MLKITSIYRTPEEHRKGLMYHRPLIGDEAVMFITPNEKTSGFWNKNVSFPIDVAFFDKNKYLINIESLNKGQLLSVLPEKAWKYVVETRLDWFKDNNIKKGTHMDLIVDSSLTKLGFNKISAFDPTATHQPTDKSTWTKIKNTPTSQAIDSLSKEWFERKPSQQFGNVRKFKKDVTEVRS